MGCCQAAQPPQEDDKGGFQYIEKKPSHETVKSLTNKSQKESAGSGPTATTNQFYHSRNIKSSNEGDNNASIPAMADLKPQQSSDSSSANETHALIPYTSDYNAQIAAKSSSSEDAVSSHKASPLKYAAVKTSSPPGSSRSTLDATTTTAAANTNTNANALQPDATTNGRDREPSMSHSRRFRPRPDRSKSPQIKPASYVSSDDADADAGPTNTLLDEPPEIDDDDNGSSASDDVELPVLLFSDSAEEDAGGGDEVDDEEQNLKIMQYLIVEENKRIEKEIRRVQSFIDEQETKQIEEEVLKEIEMERAQSPDIVSDNEEDMEEERNRKFVERMHKKQQQRQRQKHDKKAQRKLAKEEHKKKHDQELQKYSVAVEQQPQRDDLNALFNAYFLQPFKTQSTHKNGTSSGEKLRTKAINLDGFLAGVHALDIDKMMSPSDVQLLRDTILQYSPTTYDFTATDLVFFLNVNPETLKPKLAIVQRKVLYLLTQQHHKTKKAEKADAEVLPEEQEIMPVSEPLHVTHDSEDTVTTLGSSNRTRKHLNRTTLVSPKCADIITPIETLEDDDGDDDDKNKEHNGHGNGHVPQQSSQQSQLQNGRRRPSVSMSESMSMSVSTVASNVHVPRQSFKQVNYKWNDSISQKSFNNYKRLKHRFASRYQHAAQKTMDQELMNMQEKLISEAINANNNNNNQASDADDSQAPPQIIHREGNEDGDERQKEEKMEEKLDDSAAPVPVAQAASDKAGMRLSYSASKSSHSKPAQHTNGVVPSKTPLTDINELQALQKKKSPHQDFDDDRFFNSDGEDDDDDEDGGEENKEEADDEAARVRESLMKIANYRGNDDMLKLTKLYKEQHKMKKKLERLRKHSLLKLPAPPKPQNVEDFIDNHTRYVCKELQVCMCRNTRYIGIANFGPNGEMGIEIEFKSDADEKGYLKGKRVPSYRKGSHSVGVGRIWADIDWNGHKWVPCCKFEWKDESDGITTKLEFNSVKHEIDVDHSFFEGVCVRYPSDLNPKRRTTKLIQHEGFFDFVCVSARRRTIRKNSLLQYHTLDINEMNDDELQKVPKYVRRMSAYTEKIDQFYKESEPATKEALFGDAVNTVASFHDMLHNDPVTSDTSMPEQIHE